MTEIFYTNIQGLSLNSNLLARLSPARLEKMSKMRRESDKLLCAGCGLLLAHLFGGGTKEPELFYGPHGKPYLKSGNSFFSLSHSGSYAVCAVSGLEVGVDVQIIRSVNFQRIARRFHKTEQDLIYNSLSPAEQFFRLWTLKESFLKATGEGISRPLNDFYFDLDKNISIHGTKENGKYSFFTFDELENHVLSICQTNNSTRPVLKELIIYS